jgi:pimeloyl-ACP methyl ester carboxylesterase
MSPLPPAPATSPRFLYLHGFASGPESTKGLAFSEHFARLGVAIERLDLRVPSLERLRLSAVMAATRAAIGGERDRAVLLGSSLGGLTAARVAALDARVCALVLLAPAFRLAELWRARLGEEGRRRWRESGWLEIDDYVTRQKTRIDHGFLEDLEAIDDAESGWPDVRVPALIVHGRFDDVVDIDRSRAFAAGKRHVRLVEVDDGHDLTATLPRTLAAAEAFLVPFLGA